MRIGRPGQPGSDRVIRRVAVELPTLVGDRGAVVWEVTAPQAAAAWELHAELATRIPDGAQLQDHARLRDALTSLYRLIGITRDLLHAYGRPVAPDGPALSFGLVAVRTVNGVLRPLLEHWHPQLAAYEAARLADTDPFTHELAWPQRAAAQAAITAAFWQLADITRVLAEADGADELTDAPAGPEPGSR